MVVPHHMFVYLCVHRHSARIQEVYREGKKPWSRLLKASSLIIGLELNSLWSIIEGLHWPHV